MEQKVFDFLRGPLNDYILRVAAMEHVPGGGSVAACVAALSSSSLEMVVNYTLGKKKYREYEERLEKIKKENEEMLQVLSGYIEEDSRLYDSMTIYSKTNPQEAEKYTKQSASLHLDICRKMLVIIEFAEFLAEKGNKNLISDTGIAAALALSAFKSAKLNVYINIKHLDDKNFSDDCINEMAKLEEIVDKQGNSVYNIALNYLS